MCILMKQLSTVIINHYCFITHIPSHSHFITSGINSQNGLILRVSVCGADGKHARVSRSVETASDAPSVRPSITAPNRCPKIFFRIISSCVTRARRPVLMFLSRTYPAATGASMQICDVHPCPVYAVTRQKMLANVRDGMEYF
jgi:hypothetical protein